MFDAKALLSYRAAMRYRRQQKGHEPSTIHWSLYFNGRTWGRILFRLGKSEVKLFISNNETTSVADNESVNDGAEIAWREWGIERHIHVKVDFY